MCVIWRIWRGRNELILENKSFIWEEIFEDIKVRLWSWVANIYPNLCNFVFNDWLSDPRTILENL